MRSGENRLIAESCFRLKVESMIQRSRANASCSSREWARPESEGRLSPCLDEAFRTHRAEALATLIRLVRDFDLAEEALQEAFAAAATAWGETPPASPRAWLVTVGRRKALDQLRRRIAFRARADALRTLAEIEAEAPPEEGSPDAAFGGDDMLR